MLGVLPVDSIAVSPPSFSLLEVEILFISVLCLSNQKRGMLFLALMGLKESSFVMPEVILLLINRLCLFI